MEQHGRLARADGVELAWSHIPAARAHADDPTVVFLPGFRSDMTGEKARTLADWAERSGRAFLRFDYSGHGASGGRFEDGTIGIWAADALRVIEATTRGKLLLVGSSMGGWIALLAARKLGGRVGALVGIAAAPDFTERGMWDAMAPIERSVLERDGFLRVPSPYGADLIITRALIEDGRQHLLLDGPIPITCPVRLLQGKLDLDVNWETALKLSDRLESADVRVILLKDGEHRLSRPEDLALLKVTVDDLLANIA